MSSSNDFWYFYSFLTERGRAGLAANRRDIAKVIWRRNSPNWHFDDGALDRASVAFDNPDYVEVVLHSYRHRFGYAPGSPPYDQIEQQLAVQPDISVPTVTLDGLADGNFPATDGTVTSLAPRVHHQVQGTGHNLPQEAPNTFASAVLELAHLRSPSGGE